MNEKPEALRLAEWAEWFCRNVKSPQDFRWKHMAEAAAELRRLHALNVELLEALKLLDEAYCNVGQEMSREDRANGRQALIKARAAIDKAGGAE